MRAPARFTTMETSRGSLNRHLSSLIGIWLADLAVRKYRWLTGLLPGVIVLDACEHCTCERTRWTNIQIFLFLFIRDVLSLSLSLSLSLFLYFYSIILFFRSFIFSKSCFTFSSHSTGLKIDRLDKSFCSDIGKRLHRTPTDLFFEITLSVAGLSVQFCKHRPQLSDKLSLYLLQTRPSARCALFVCYILFARDFLVLFNRVAHRRNSNFKSRPSLLRLNVELFL